jgi:methionyl-tRNA synthetase
MNNKDDKSIIITCALPYANGDLHLGHILEYVQADIYARAKRMQGHNVHFICAEDAHGTPIEINAMKQEISPEELIEKMRESHIEDLSQYKIEFDEFYTTHSDENRKLAQEIFEKLKENGYIEKKEIEQLYCETDRRFLPDRFIKGECPYCKAKDQYGDICESCGRTYSPEQLKEPYCILCSKPPVIKKSSHYFFLLSKTSDEIKDYIENKAILQKETKNYVLTWIDKGLQDWDITRDGPYFGFKIPGEENKYFYVWLDAPIGYLASLEHYKKRLGIEKDLWNESHILHVIGKDIMYFHLLFWPAVLMHSGYKPPDQIQVHGFLTVGGEKMSKSRGTFILAKDMRNKVQPELIRYYMASQLSSSISDINYSAKELQNKVNHELIGNIMNMHYRIGSLIEKKKVAAKGNGIDKELIQTVMEKHDAFMDHIGRFEHSSAVRQMLMMGDAINKYLQENKPWAIEDPSTILRNAYHAAIITLPSLYCIMPKTAEEAAMQYGMSIDYIMDIVSKSKEPEAIVEEIDNLQKNESISVSPKIIYERIEIVNAKEKNNGDGEASPFENMILKVAVIKEAKEHPDAESLYVLQLDLGKEKTQIVSGLKGHYAIEELEGKKIIIVENMKPAKIRGVESRGMLLAGSIEAKEGEVVVLLEPHGKSHPGEVVVAENHKKKKDTGSAGVKVKIKDVQKSGLYVKDKKVYSPIGALLTKDGSVTLDLPDNAKIH